jgi:uncharacterized protein (DUF1778 family)
MVAESFIQCRVSADTKSALRAAAQEQGVTESVILKRLLLSSLGGAHLSDEAILRPGERIARSGRLSIRLRRDDALLLQSRAEARGMPAATYASVALRAHLIGSAPVPHAELEVLRNLIRALESFRTMMSRIASQATMRELAMMLKLCESARDQVTALLDKNLRSWQ